MIKAVIFDLDGLLVDSEPISYQLYQNILAPYGKSMTISHYADGYCGHSSKDILTRLLSEFQLPLSYEEIRAIKREEEHIYTARQIPLKPGALELLNWLKERGYRILLATSSTRERATGMLQVNGLDHYFDDMVFGAELKRSKPFPDIFLLAAQKAGALPQECLVLEDSEAGIQAAHSGGVPVICVPDMKQPSTAHKAMAVALYESLADVIPYLQKQEEN